jgi:23S rRNA pseudouridine1911/1915/1917 synthase
MEGRSIVPFNLPFLYEDNHVLVVNKPSGMLSQGDLTGDLDVLTAAKQIIKQRDDKPGNVFLGLVHRLDRPVSGVMLLAKTSKCASRLSLQFRERTTTKIYWARVEGVPDATQGELRHRLGKDPKTRITRAVSGAQGKEARLRYRVLDTQSDTSLLEVTLITGLSHQIRAQLSALGHPVVGDKKYGSRHPFRPGAIALMSKSITFSHPTKKETITVCADLPDNLSEALQPQQSK